jgi:DNA-binding NarL/FixJ family response regulator
MPTRPLSVAVLTHTREEARRVAAVLDDGDVQVVQKALDVDRLEPSLETGIDAVVLSCLSADADVKRSVLGLKRHLPQVPVVALVRDGDASLPVRGALQAHAEGVLFGDRIGDALVATVRAVSAGQIALPRSQYRHARPVVLSHRECQVLRLAVEGMTNDSIAQTLFISRSTVKSHLTSAFAKLSVRSRSEAAAVLSNPDEPATRLVFGGREGEAAETGDYALARGAA